MEIWKDVVGFERAYQVSNLGRVKSKIRHGVISERLLKPFKNNQGYECVDLWDNNHKKKLVHRLVAEAFIANEAAIYYKTALICEDRGIDDALAYFMGTHTEDEYQEFRTSTTWGGEE